MRVNFKIWKQVKIKLQHITKQPNFSSLFVSHHERIVFVNEAIN